MVLRDFATLIPNYYQDFITPILQFEMDPSGLVFNWKNAFVSLENAVRAQTENYYKDSLAKLENYRQIVDKYAEAISPDNTPDENTNWHSPSIQLINDIGNWLESDPYGMNHSPDKKLHNFFDIPFQNLLKESPAEENMIFDPGLMAKMGQDSFLLGIRKQITRNNYKIRIAAHNIKNAVLKIIKKESPMKAITYTMPSSEFNTLYYYLPAQDILYRAWLRYLREWNRVLMATQENLAGFRLSNKDIPEISTHILEWANKFKDLLIAMSKDLKQSLAENLETIGQDMKLQVAKYSHGLHLSQLGYLPAKRIRKKYKKRKNQIYHNHDKGISAWLSCSKGHIKDWKKDLDLQKTIFLALQKCLLCDNPTRDTITGEARELCIEIKKHTTEIRQDIESPNGINEGDWLQKFSSKFMNLFQSKIIYINSNIASSNAGQIIKDHHEDLKSLLEFIPDPCPQMPHLNFSGDIPQFTLTQAPIRSVVQYNGLNVYFRKHSEVQKIIQENKTLLCQTLIGLTEVLKFNLETARGLVKKGNKAEESIQENISAGLLRIESQLDEFLKNLDDFESKTGTIMAESRTHLVNLLEDLKIQDNVLKLSVMASHSKWQASISAWKEFTGKKLNRFKRKGTIYSNQGLGLFKQFFQKARKVSRLDSGAVAEADSISQYLKMVLKKLESLPLIYKTVFKFSALDNPRFYLPRKEEKNILSQNYNSWLEGGFSATAIVGEQGCGMTSFLNIYAPEIFEQTPIIRKQAKRGITTERELTDFFNPISDGNAPSTLSELASEIIRGKSKHIFIIEDFHLLFIRTMDGLKLMDKINKFIGKTEAKIFWTITCNRYAWDLINPLIQIDGTFRFVIPVEKLNRKELELLIDSRHSLTGYQLEFSARKKAKPENILTLIKSKSKPDSRTEFFNRLEGLTEGNISVAIYYWLKSIQNIDRQKITIDTELSAETGFLHFMDADNYFTLAALIQHGTLSSAEHAKIFRQLRGQSKLQLKKLEDQGILFENEGRFQIHFFLYRAVIKLLQEKHLIHS